MRRIALVVGLVVVVGVGLAWWLRGRSHDPAPAKTTAAQTGRGKKRAAGPRAPAKPATVSGRVTRKADGSGVAGAVVSLASAELGADFAASKAPTIVVTTDDAGAWTATEVAPGDYVIAATATGLLPAAREKLTLAAGEQRTGIDFVLDAGGTLVTGTVSDVGGGPIASARVTAERERFSLAAGAEYVALTGPDGTYQLSLPDGEYELSATHDNYTRARRSAEVDGKPVTVDFTLIPGGVIRGQVVARDSGQPVPRALVAVRPERRSRGSGTPSVLTDADGNFVVRGLSSGGMAIEARGHGYASSQPTVVQLGIGEEVDGIQVLVDRAFTISGRVVEKGTQTGIAGARVGAFTMSSRAQAEAIEPSDTDGAFEIAGVRPGSYMLYAGADGAMLEIGHNVDVVDKDVTDVIIELATGATITGRVEPPTVATISLELQAEVGLGNMFEMIKAAMSRTESDATGVFTLKNAPPGKLRVVAVAKDGRTGKTPITVASVDQSGIVVTLEPRASIAGRVVDTSGKPMPGFTVEANLKDDRPMRFSMAGLRRNTTSGSDGSFQIVGLEPGTYELHARMAGELDFVLTRDDKDKRRVTVELAAGAAHEGVTLVVDARDGVIRGQVIGADGKPAADAWVTARRALERPEGMPEAIVSEISWLADSEPVLTGEDGRFVITKLKKGNYTLVAEGPRGGSRGEKKDVKVGDNVTIPLASLGTLAVTVTQGGAPVTSYDVTCRGPAASIDRHAATTDGTYTLERLAPGDYTCRVRAEGGTAEGKVAVPPGEAKLPLALAAWGSLTGTVVSILTGKPVPGLAVVTNSEDNAGGIMDAIVGRAPKTGAEGRFVLDKVAAGKGRVLFVAPDNSMSSLESHEYTARAGERVDLGIIKIVPPRTGEAGTYGLATEPDGDTLKVTSVKEGGPAAAAGIVAGDKITALEGQAVKALTPALAQKLIASGAVGVGQSVKVTLERGSTVVLTAVKW